jgi:uncharacterized membrane protein
MTVGRALRIALMITIVICLLPVITVIGSDLIKIFIATLPWWTWVIVAIVCLILLASLVAKFLPKRHRHDHYYH